MGKTRIGYGYRGPVTGKTEVNFSQGTYSAYFYREKYRFVLEVMDGFIESDEKVCIYKGGKKSLLFFCKSKEIKGWKMDWQSAILMEDTIYLHF